MNEADVLTNNAYFSVNSEGELTFTEQGIAEYRSYFGKAGVDIRDIKSLDDFRRARRAASPFFEDRLVAKVKKGEKTLERRLLIAIAEGNEKEINRIERLLHARNNGIQAINACISFLASSSKQISLVIQLASAIVDVSVSFRIRLCR
jgi:hypothetical protein